MSKHVVILGAGLAGLSTAYHLGNGCQVYEREDVPGGLARTDMVDGFTFDYDGHLLHCRSEYIDSLITRLLPEVFVRHKRNAAVFSQGVYTRYPFQANTFGLPSTVVKRCIMGMVNAAAGKTAILRKICGTGC
jgi:Protoporphyrinogen oxidase